MQIRLFFIGVIVVLGGFKAIGQVSLASDYIYKNEGVKINVDRAWAEENNIIKKAFDSNNDKIGFDSIVFIFNEEEDSVFVLDSMNVNTKEKDVFSKTYYIFENLTDKQNVYHIEVYLYYSGGSFEFDQYVYYNHKVYYVYNLEGSNGQVSVIPNVDTIYINHSNSVNLYCDYTNNCVLDTFPCPSENDEIATIYELEELKVYINDNLFTDELTTGVTEHEINLTPGLNRIRFDAFDEKGNIFSDSISVFYIDILETITSFSRDQEYVKIDAIPKGGYIQLKDSLYVDQKSKGVDGNTVVLNPSKTHESVGYCWLVYNYVDINIPNIIFKDSMQINITEGSDIFAIIGEDEVCPYAIENYSCHVNENFDFRWSVKGGRIMGDETASSVDIEWGKQLNSSISLEITDKFSGDKMSKDLIVKVGSNGKDFEDLEFDKIESNANENSFLLACTNYGENAFYTWKLNNETISTTTSNYCYVTADGEYSVRVMTSSNRGCEYEKSAQIALEDIDSDVNIRIFPNPFSKYITIQINSEVGSLTKYRLLDMAGHVIDYGSFKRPMYVLDVHDKKNGIYILELEHENSKSHWTLVK